MNREDIIKLAREVGYPLVEYEGTPYIPPLLAVLLETVAAAQKQWVGLTHQETKDCMQAWDGNDAYVLCRAIEAKLKEKNT
jgi:hypothetical protein